MPQSATATPPPPDQQDWFAQNAPSTKAKPAAAAAAPTSSSSGDWFNDNAPSAASSSLPIPPSFGPSTIGPAPFWTRVGNTTVPGTGVTLNEAGKRANEFLHMAGTESMALLGPMAAIDAPLATAGAVGTGYIAGKAAKKGASAIGMGSTAQDLAENTGNIVGGGTGAKMFGDTGVAGAPINERLLERSVNKGTRKYAQGLGLPNPPDVEGLAGKQAPDSVNAARDIQVAQKDIAKIERESPAVGKGSAATFSHARAIKSYMDTLWDESHAGPVLRTSSKPAYTDGNPLYDAGQKVLTPEAMDADPAGARQAKRWLDTNVNKPRTIGSTDQFIRELNADLEAPAAQKAYGPLMARAKMAVRDAARDALNTGLMREGEGGITEANQRWGALNNILERTLKAGEAEAKTEGKGSAMPDWVRTYLFAHTGGMHGGVSIHPAEAFPTTPSKQIVSGAQRLARTRLEPPPVDRTPLVPGTTGPDTSGPVRNTAPPLPDMNLPASHVPPNAAGAREATGTVQPIAMGPGTGGPRYTGPLRPPPRTMLPALPERAGQPPGGGANPATGFVGQEFRKLGLTDLITPRQATTLETMMRGPRWRTLAPDERTAAVQRIVRNERF